MENIEMDLIIDYPNCSLSEYEAILVILYNSSTLCYPDIVLMAEEIILHIDEIGYSIREQKYLRLIKFIHSLFKVLGKIGNVDQRQEIHDKYNEYYKNAPISPVSSPKSPVIVSPPKIMKKPKKKDVFKHPMLPFKKK
jgi:hypothetical protein